MKDRKLEFWMYVEPGDDGVTPVYVTCSEQQILDEYFSFWCERMRRVGKQAEITEDRCIEDWVIIHWAYKGNSIEYYSGDIN